MPTIKKNLLSAVTAWLLFPAMLLAQNPVAKDENITIRAVADSPYESVRLSHSPLDNTLYLLTRYGEIFRVGIDTGDLTELQNSSDHNLEDVQGMDISENGEFYIIGNVRDNVNFTNTAVVKKGIRSGNSWEWRTIAQSEPYPLSNTFFDHVMNGIVLSPDNDFLFINSGSRTDHGEVHDVSGRYPNLREAPLTAKILRVPLNEENQLLENDIDYLLENGYLYADGTRNSFSLAFNEEGKLFAAENAGERDDPGELNWIREGHHYGFPWVVGGNENPMQFEGYIPEEDLLLPTATGSYHYFYNDPDYPAPPGDVIFTPAILNYGPDAVNFRDPVTGAILNAAEQDTAIQSFTGHRSPLGLLFDVKKSMDGEYTGDAFVLGFTGGDKDAYLLRFMGDPGEDLIHVELKPTEEGYEMNTRTVVSGFVSPVDSEIINNTIYVVEHRNPQWLNNNTRTRIWEITFPGVGTSKEENWEPIASEFELLQNYPNPFNPSTVISYRLPVASNVRLDVYDLAGRKVSSLIEGEMKPPGTYTVRFDATNLSSGVYLYRLTTGNISKVRQMVFIK